MMRYFLFILMFFCISIVHAETVLNVYNWSDYLPDDVLKQFEEETHIKVNYSEYDSNETLYSKLKTNPHIGYDVIFPSCYFIHRMKREGMLKKLDKSQLPNIKYLSTSLLRKSFDVNNDVSVPYLWGAAGIVVNTRYFQPNTITSWNDFWKPELYNKLLVFDDVREMFSVALITLGYSINDTNPEHINQAYLKLKQLLPNIKLFNSEAVQSIYIDEDAVIGMGYNGEIYNAQLENPHLMFTYPKQGFEMWMDCMAIPLYAPHPEAAHQFINFLTRPDIAKKIAMTLGFSSPNREAVKMMPASFRNNIILNPPPSILKHGQFLMDLGDVNLIYEKYWELLKLGGIRD